jgi:phage/plasmid-like protein (TIGR03299 family)
MAHNINFKAQTEQHSFFSVKEKPWHRLGQIVQDYPTSAEAIKFAGLDYFVNKQKIYTQRNSYENPHISIPDYVATIRTDTEQVLGVVGKDYEVVQNKDAFSFFDAIIGGDGLPAGLAGIQYETAGALGNGERIFITAKLPGYIKVGNDDLIEQYIFLTTSHDGFGSITAAFTPTRIVCNNTLNAALHNCTNCIKIRHTTGAKERLEQAHRLMGITNRLSADLQNIFNHWSKKPITDHQVKKLIQLAMVPNKEVLENIKEGKEDNLSTCFKNMCDNAFEYAMSNPTQQMETTKGTLFGAYNSITGYFQDVRRYKNDEAKLKSILFGGTGQLRSQTAFNLCNDFSSGKILLN